MRIKNSFLAGIASISVLFPSIPAYAVSATSTVNVTIARYLSIVNTKAMEFGTVSVSATPGTVIVGNEGSRFSTGGVILNPSGSFSPAQFLVEGKPNASVVLLLPEKVELRNDNGDAIVVNNFDSNAVNNDAQLDARGALELSIGGQINFDANQASGSYRGTMTVELDYS